MKISNIYIGGWFQRTMLQLSEIYDFVREAKSQLNLEQKKLTELHNNLEIKSINYGVSGEEYIEIFTNLEIKIKIFEDGLIILNSNKISAETLFNDIQNVTNYYEKRLSPALSYLFSLGAPIPKELANIETKDILASSVEKYEVEKNNDGSGNVIINACYRTEF